MTWTEALKKFYKAKLTNRDAAGLIEFARAVWRAYDKDKNVAFPAFDWYPWALLALGYFKLGDKFKIDTAFQLSPFAKSLELWEQLNGIAQSLDAAGIPFRAVVDPRGTDKGFRKLASDAWGAMKTLRAADATAAAAPPPFDPDARKGFASPDDPFEVVATVKPKKKTEPEQIELPGIETPKKQEPATSSGGGGAALLFLLFAFGSKKGRGRRSARR
jgi:hypothetical protein